MLIGVSELPKELKDKTGALGKCVLIGCSYGGCVKKSEKFTSSQAAGLVEGIMDMKCIMVPFSPSDVFSSWSNLLVFVD